MGPRGQDRAWVWGRRRRVVAGFLIAPWVPAVLLELARLLPAFRNSAGIGVILHSYLTVWLFGAPAFLVLEKCALRQAWHYALGGFLLMQVLAWSSLFAIFPDEMSETDFSYAGWTKFAALMGVLAAGTATAFWAIAVRPSARAYPPAPA